MEGGERCSLLERSIFGWEVGVTIVSVLLCTNKDTIHSVVCPEVTICRGRLYHCRLETLTRNPPAPAGKKVA